MPHKRAYADMHVHAKMQGCLPNGLKTSSVLPLLAKGLFKEYNFFEVV